ncbi:MAG TPA: thiol-disulfide oxidoreductase DCC family protein [Chitinophagaceae bacterium]
MNTQHPVLYFDGVCNLCNRSVQYIIKKDKKKLFRFASLQGKSGQAMLAKNGIRQDDFNSFILVEGEKIFTRSTAALRVFRLLGGSWKILYVLIIVPRFLRDPVYNWIARNRYKWYGKRDECMVPTAELRDRFLE